MGPGIDKLIVALAIGKGAFTVIVFDGIDPRLSRIDDFLLLAGNAEIRYRDRQSTQRRVFETQTLDIIEQIDGSAAVDDFEAIADHSG